MVTIDNLYAISSKAEECLAMLGDSITRDGLRICMTLKKKDVMALDEALHDSLGLYPLSGYMPNDKIDIKIWGIAFEIRSTED